MLKFWQKSLRIQIAGSFSFLSLTVVALTGSLAFYQARDTLSQAVFKRLKATASLKESDLNRWLADRRDMLLSLNQLTEMNQLAEVVLTGDRDLPEYELAEARLERLLSDFIRDRTNYDEIFVLSKGGRVLVSSNPESIGWYATLNKYTDISQPSASFVSTFYQSPQTGQPIVTFTVPILNDRSEQMGMLAAHLDLNHVDKSIRFSRDLGQTIDAYLVTDIGSYSAAKNVFVSSARFGSDEFPNGIESPGINAAIAGNDGYGLYLNHKGVPVLGVYSWLEQQDFALIVEIEQDEAFAPARRLAIVIFLIGLGLASVLTVGIGILSNRMVEPILDIAQVAGTVRSQVRRGDFANLETAQTTAENEVGTLADTFNQLTQQLSDSYKVLQGKNKEIQTALSELEQTQLQLIQNEKMASLGQMVAGIAHEINNPVSFIYGNLQHVEEYAGNLLNLVQLYECEYPDASSTIEDEKTDIDLTFLKQDLPKVLESMQIGTTRIQDIVLSMRNFSRLDESGKKTADLHEGMEGTLLILQSRLKSQANRPEIDVIKDYGQLSPIECYPGQLNQVFLNLMSNAIDAIETGPISNPTIRITTHLVADSAVITVADNGPGMPDTVRQKIFDPFFTTKPVGSGTGLGLSISYSIIVKRHHGTLECHSTPDEGTEFVISIPITTKPKVQCGH